MDPSFNPAFPDGRPLEVGRNFLLVPGGTDAVDTDRIAIHLTRGKAFGSGLHETTVNCIEAIEGLPSLENRSVLDVGTGTGILSLAALLLGARSAVAFDIDMDAVRTCYRNADINKLSLRLKVFQGTFEALCPFIKFDLVLANIHGDIILAEAHQLAGRTVEGGYLILSGLDFSDGWSVKSTMRKQGMELISVLFLEDYVTQVWRHPQGLDRKEL